jgi:hypothetical protein
MAYFRCRRKALFHKAFKKVFSHRFYTFSPFIKIIGYALSSPIKVADRAFSTEKKAIRFAKKIVPLECIKKEEK